MKEILQQNHLRKDREKDDPRSCTTIPYIHCVSKVVTRILLDINIHVHMKPFRTLRRILSHPKDCISDDESPALCTRSIVVTVMPAM